MNDKKDVEMTDKLISMQFDDIRHIVKKSDDEIQKIAQKHKIEATIYETDRKELISYGIQNEDLTTHELDKYVKYGEELYEISGKTVSIYLMGPPNIECKTKRKMESNAPIVLKLAISSYSQTYDVLRHIKNLVKNKKKLDNGNNF